MKKLALAFLLLPSLAYSQQAQPGMNFAFDYVLADLKAYNVTQFELKIDTGGFTSIGLPLPETLPDTPAGFGTFKAPIPALSQGQHVFTIRACNGTVCSPEAAAYAFTFVIVPSAPKNLRLVPGVR